ncbi:hypothetical protein DR046_22155 [Jannaschia formosa]|nr:hypothetical protein DR046_22155 [Jannaschia formosa]
MHHFYSLSVDRDLFGQPILVIRRGRRGRPGRIGIAESGPRGAMRRRLAEIASWKILRGYRKLETAGPRVDETALPLFEPR